MQGVKEVFTQTSEGLGGLQCTDESGAHEVVKVKPKVQGKPRKLEKPRT